MTKSKEFFEKAKRLIPGGVNSPVRAFSLYPFFTERALFFTPTPVCDYRMIKTADAARFFAYHAVLLKEGVFVPPSQFETCFLSTEHSAEDLKRTVEVLSAALLGVK